MLLVHVLLSELDRLLTDDSGKLAWDWFKRLLDYKSMAIQMGESESDPIIDVSTIDWKAEWPEFRQNLKAVQWIVTQRMGRKSQRREREAIPDWVRNVIDKYVRSIPVVVVGKYADELTIQPAKVDGEWSVFPMHDNVDQFWEMLMPAVIDPNWGPFIRSVCSRCLKILPPLKNGKSPRAKWCRSCQVARYRERNPEQAREASRLSQRKKRQRQKAEKQKGAK